MSCTVAFVSWRASRTVVGLDVFRGGVGQEGKIARSIELTADAASTLHVAHAPLAVNSELSTVNRSPHPTSTSDTSAIRLRGESNSDRGSTTNDASAGTHSDRPSCTS